MIPKKQLEVVSEEEKKVIEDVEKQIDESLKHFFKGGAPIFFWVNSLLDKYPPNYRRDVVIREIVEMYKSGGWIVKEDSNDNGEKNLTFS